MITASAKKSEVQYRALPLDSSSTIKEFLVDPKRYFQKYVMEEKVEEEDSKASLIGSLVHCLLLEPDLFDSKFYASSVESKPTESMLNFTEILYEETIAHTNELGEVTMDMSDLCMLAYNKSGIKSWKLETVLKKWQEGTGESYYNELLHTRPMGIAVVTDFDMKIAEGIEATLKSDDFISAIILQQEEEGIDVYTELQIEGEEYKIWDLPTKGMIDKLIVNHNREIIQLWDLKITWEPRNFYKGYYLYRRAYIQASVYYKLVCIWAKLNGYEDYTVEYPKFIVADSGNFYKPLIYSLSSKDIADADDGFTYGSTNYKGLHEVITDLKWARDKNEWKIGREEYINKGVVNLK